MHLLLMKKVIFFTAIQNCFQINKIEDKLENVSIFAQNECG